MKETYYYSLRSSSPPRVAMKRHGQGTSPWRLLLVTFALSLMAMIVPLQAYAGAHFSNSSNGRITHQPTPDEPWTTVYFYFYDEDGGDGYFLHDETQSGHGGPAVYVDGKYVCSPDWELAWPAGNGNASGLEDERGVSGWWGSTYTNTVDGVNYTVRFWDPRKSGSKFYVEMVVYMDKMAVGKRHDIKIRGKWRINGESTQFEERTLGTNDLKDIFSNNIQGHMYGSRTYGAYKVTGSELNTGYGPTTVALTTESSYHDDGKYIEPSLLNNAVYKTYDKGVSNYNGLTLNYDDLIVGGRFYVYSQQSVTVTPKDRPSTIIYGWRKKYVDDFLTASKLEASSDMWKKQVSLVWEANVKSNDWADNGYYGDGTWSVFRYPEGHEEAKVKVAEGLTSSTRKYVDDVPEYDQEYAYELTFIPTGSPTGKQLPWLSTMIQAGVNRLFPISVTDVVSGKSDITVKWQCPEFKGNENYAFKLLRTESHEGLPGDDWTEVTTVNVIDKGKTRYEYTDTRDLKLCPTYIYKVQTTMLENKVFASANILEGKLTGNSQVTSVTATKGDYNGLVKIAWEAEQVSTDATRYEVARRVKGNDTWAVIYKTSGTATSYYYEDQTALPGQYYDYKVVSITTCDGSDTRLEKSDDGFSRSTGIVSGRVIYGTGTAVAGTRVDLVRGDGNVQQAGQFYALRVTGAGDGVFFGKDCETLNRYFSSRPFTLQMYIRPDGEQGTPTILDLGGKLRLTLGQPGANGKGFPLNIQGSEASVFTGVYLQPDVFTSLTLAVDAAGVPTVTAIYEDDSLSIVSLAGKCNANVRFADGEDTGLCLGGSYESSAERAFSGYIDEMRVFSGKALSKEDILANYNHTLCGTEDALVAYWPVDEGFEGQATAYDYSKTSGVANGNHARLGAGTSPTCSTIPTPRQLGLFALTDAQGNFVVRGVPFTGEGTNYMVVPTLGIHEFSPIYSTRYVSASSLVHSGVDFTDVSSFPVSGTVFYEGTDYPVEGCAFYVDGTICSRDGELVQSAADGTFTISVPIGDHFIQVKKDGHVFASEGRYPADPNGAGVKLTYDREIKNMEFVDQTLVNLSGRVVGGSIDGDKPVGFGASKNNIGITELILSPVNDRYRLNVVKQVTGTSYSYETNTSPVKVESATSAIASRSWRGAGDAARKIYIRTDSLTGEFSAMVPPLMYNVESMKVVSTGQSVGDATTVDVTNPLVEYTDTLVDDNGMRQEYAYHSILCQTYHNAPSFIVTQRDHDDVAFGLSRYEIEDANGKLAIDDIYTIANDGSVTYNYGGAIFEREENYVFDLCGFEEYVNNDTKGQPVVSRVPLSGSVVTINNALSASQKVYYENNGAGKPAGSLVELESNQMRLDSLGCAVYRWKAGLPNITAPYSRTISISYDIDDRTYNWDGSGMNGIILGSLPTGNNFVTSGPDVVEMILRDPPGTGSSAEWTSGSVTSTSTSYGSVWTSDSEALTSTKFGVKVESLTGTLGFGILNSVESVDELNVGLHVTTEGENANTWNRVITATRAISTSSAPEYVGGKGDVFIGSATNIIYGLARDINFRRQGTSGKAALGLKDIITTGLDFKTMFNYTENYVENVLLPNLRAMRDNLLRTVTSTQGYDNSSDHPVYLTTLSAEDPRFGSSNHDKKVWGSSATSRVSTNGPSYTMVAPGKGDASYEDSVEWCNSQIRIWENTLALNEKEKVLAYENRGESLDQNLSFDSGSSVTISRQTEESHGTTREWTVTAAVVLSNSWGMNINNTGVQCTVSTQTGGGSHHVSENTATEQSSFSYTLAEEGDDDALTVDVYKYGAFSPIFRTRGGQTSGPYEGEVKTRYYRPGTTIMEATMQIEVPHIAVDVPTVTNVPTGSAANYTLRLTNASEIDEDVYYKLLMIDESNPYGAKITIDGMPLTDNRIIKIPAGQTVTKAMQLWQTNTSVLGYKDIGIVLASQTQYDPTSTWDQIADTVYVSAQFVPSSSAVTMRLDRTTLNSQTGDELNITFSQFDRDYRNLKAFRIQYRKQGNTDWTLVREYVVKEEDKTANNDLLPETAMVSYKLTMHDLSDGDYTFRVLSVSSYGSEEVYGTSEEITVVKDMRRPLPLGLPSPADGVLSPGDDVSIEFNEKFLKGELTKTANFIVTGVLNGAEVSHSTALAMTGADNTATTEADINLAGKSFSIDAWLYVKGAGTLLTHGKGRSKLMISVGDDNRLNIGIGDNVYTSGAEMPLGKWSYLSVSYAATVNGGTLTAAVAEEANTIGLFEDEAVVAYEGDGPLAIGQRVNGAIHELALWDEARDMSSVLMEKSKTKNPSTRHLIGYWKMDEGEGTVATDYARNRHLRLNRESWYVDNENKAVKLDGTSCLEIPAADISPLPADNCAMELWMRAGAQNGEAQLLQAGEVQLWMNADGLLLLSSGDNTLASGSSSLQDNAWHHVALNILRGGNAAVYVDGERVMAVNVADVGSTATDKVIVGARRMLSEDSTYVYDRQLVGSVDEVRLWNATLSAAILKANRKTRLLGTEQGLVAYYPFEKKTLDAYNQTVTVGTDVDLVRADRKAVCSDTLVFTDDAPALREKKTETNVDYSFTASDNKIVITINETPASIVSCTLNFTVRDLRDVNGNLSLPVCWSAFVDNNELAWSENTVAMTKKVGESLSFKASFANKGGKQQMWTVSGMPSWLKASAEYGAVDPLDSGEITFEVTQATPVGKHEETVYLTGNDGIAVPLRLLITVDGDKPDWAVDKGKHENTMNVIGTLSVLGIPSYDADDIVGVFVDGECRGVARPVYNSRYDNSFVLLDVYGDDVDADKELAFKAYDASTGIMYAVATTSKAVSFSANALVGSYAEPLLIDAADKIEQSMSLSSGWNWTSFYVKADDMNVKSVFADICQDVETVKTKDEFASCENGSWHGKGFDIDNKSMYKVKISGANTLKLIGGHGAKEDRVITVAPGWNWIAYNNTQTSSVADAMAGMDPQDGDMIKGQRGFALFDGYEWTGSLTALAPGQGYMLFSASSGNRSFGYPSPSAHAARRKATSRAPSVFVPIDHHKYPSNMTITARITLEGVAQQDVEVGVFAGDECRTVEFSDEEGLAYFTVPGDSKTTLNFKMAKDGQVWASDVTIEYVDDAIRGSYNKPFEVTFVAPTSIEDILADGDANVRWFDVNGIRLQGRPNIPGVYVRSSYDVDSGMVVKRKVVIK